MECLKKFLFLLSLYLYNHKNSLDNELGYFFLKIVLVKVTHKNGQDKYLLLI